MMLFKIIWPCIIFVGIISDILFIWSVVRVSSLHTSTYIILASLACTDIGVLIGLGMVNILDIFTKPVRYANLDTCELPLFMLTWFCFTSSLVSLERYLAICHPIRHHILVLLLLLLLFVCLFVCFCCCCFWMSYKKWNLYMECNNSTTIDKRDTWTERVCHFRSATAILHPLEALFSSYDPISSANVTTSISTFKVIHVNSPAGGSVFELQPVSSVNVTTSISTLVCLFVLFLL